MFLPLLAAAALLAGEDSIAGRVTTPDGVPLAGAAVALSELHRQATTGAAGTFLFGAVPAGRYTLVVRRVGYAPLAREVTVPAAGEVVVALAASPFVIEPITVTATRSPTTTLAAPLPTASLAEDGLRREQSVSLAHALSRLPGIRSLSTGEQVGKPVIRGLFGPRVLVLADGSRLEDYSWSDEDGPSVDARLAQRIEVIRGPASVLYGSDALGGVVNVIPEELPDANGGPGFVRNGFEAYGATNNAELGAAVRVDGARGSFGWRVFGIGRHGDDLHTPGGALDNTGFGAANGEAAVGWRGAGGRTTVRYSHYGGEFKLLEAEGPPGGGGQQGGPERKLGDDRVQLTADRLVGGVRLEAKGQWQRHSLIEMSDTGVSSGGTPLEGTAFDLLLSTVSLDLLAHHGGEGLRGTVGISGLHQSNDSRGPIALVPGARVRSAAAFAFEQAALGGGRWSLLAGARLDVRRLDADTSAKLGTPPQTRDYTAVAGDVGLVYRPVDGLAIAANLGRAWRAPTLFELFANGPHPGEARYEIGRADLKAETGSSADVSVRWQGARVRAELAGYRTAIARYVYITPTTQFVHTTPTDSLRVYRYEQADALLTGAELGLEVAIARRLTLRGAADAVRGTNRTIQQPLPLVPPPRITLGAELHPGTRGAANRAAIGIEGEFVARQTRLNPLDIATAGYALLNIAADIERPMLGRLVRVDLAIRNAANTRYKSFLSRYKEFALDPGRNLLLRVSTGP